LIGRQPIETTGRRSITTKTRTLYQLQTSLQRHTTSVFSVIWITLLFLCRRFNPFVQVSPWLFETRCLQTNKAEIALQLRRHQVEKDVISGNRQLDNNKLWAATQYASAPCKLKIYSHLFARWHLFRHVGY